MLPCYLRTVRVARRAASKFHPHELPNYAVQRTPWAAEVQISPRLQVVGA